MASSKPIFKMLYLSMNENFAKQQAFLLRNVVLYSKEECRSVFEYKEYNVNNGIKFDVDTKMSAKEFAKFAAERLQAVNHRLLYGLWFGDKAACLNFHTLWNLSDYQDWELRSWQFDCDSDVLISEHQGDWLHAHDEEGTSVVF